MKQIGYEEEWLEILKSYVMPMQQKVFDGYFNDVGVRLYSFFSQLCLDGAWTVLDTKTVHYDENHYLDKSFAIMLN